MTSSANYNHKLLNFTYYCNTWKLNKLDELSTIFYKTRKIFK